MIGVMRAICDKNDAINVESHDVEFPTQETHKRFVIRSQQKSAVFSFTATIKSLLMHTKQFLRPLA